MKVGDRVITTGGIYGQVTRLNGDIIQIQIADKVRIDVAKALVKQDGDETQLFQFNVGTQF